MMREPIIQDAITPEQAAFIAAAHIKYAEATAALKVAQTEVQHWEVYIPARREGRLIFCDPAKGIVSIPLEHESSQTLRLRT